MSKHIELHGVRIQNIRGFASTYFPLNKRLAIFVGANNAGKTSIFKILKWIFSLDAEQLEPGHFNLLSKEEAVSLRPARNIRNKASRISLYVKVLDGRVRRKFSPDKLDISTLRFNFRVSNNRFYLSTSSPKKGEPSKHEKQAIELLKMIYDDYTYTYFSPDRINSEIFQDYSLNYMSSAFRDKPGPAKKVTKVFREGLSNLSKATGEVAREVERLVKRELPSGYLKEISIEYGIEKDVVISWISSQTKVGVITGSHDEQSVNINEVGTGLLSLMTLLLQQARVSDGITNILAIEEPEAFLHPPAQRTLAQLLFKHNKSRPDNSLMLVSTHSPIFVEEANYCDINVVAAHKVYQPTCIENRRSEINSAFLSGHGAEMLFYKYIMLVEGESDYLFFNAVFRRLSKHDNLGIINNIKVVPVGGNERFAPWIRLISSYSKSSNEKPYTYLAIADGDSASEVRRAVRDSGLQIPDELRDKLDMISSAYSQYAGLDGSTSPAEKTAALSAWINSCKDFNKLADKLSFPFLFMPVDLEYTITEHIDEEMLGDICHMLELDVCSLDNLLRRLGSKKINSKLKDKKKQPWIRQKIGEKLNAKAIDGALRAILIHILTRYGYPKRQAQKLLKKLA